MSVQSHTKDRDETVPDQRSSRPAHPNSDTSIRQTHPAPLIQRARFVPWSLTPGDVLQLQRTIGNQTVGRLLTRRAPRQPVEKHPEVVQRMMSDTDEQIGTFEVEAGCAMRNILDKVRFGSAAKLFNTEFWEQRKGEEDALYLKPGKSPSQGINELLTYKEQVEGMEGLESAKLDCVESIEVARWLAEMKVIGETEFDAKYGGSEFRLAAPGSTGIETRVLAIRAGARSDAEYYMDGSPYEGRFQFREGEIEGHDKNKLITLGKLLAVLPIGARVMWRNFDREVPGDDDFKNENTVKVGPDEWAAHPFGVRTLVGVAGEIATGGFENMSEKLKDEESGELAEYYAGINSIEDYINRFVRIVEVEIYKSPL